MHFENEIEHKILVTYVIAKVSGRLNGGFSDDLLTTYKENAPNFSKISISLNINSLYNNQTVTLSIPTSGINNFLGEPMKDKPSSLCFTCHKINPFCHDFHSSSE